MDLHERIKSWRCYNHVNVVSRMNNIDSMEIFALILAESGGDQYAIRYEKNYKWIYDKNRVSKLWNCTPDTAEMMQKCSYGLCQIMGSTFINHGYDQRPSALFTYELNIECAVKIWKELKEKYGNNPLDTYAAFNAGTVKKDNGIYKNHVNVSRYKSFFDGLKND